MGIRLGHGPFSRVPPINAVGSSRDERRLLCLLFIPRGLGRNQRRTSSNNAPPLPLPPLHLQVSCPLNPNPNPPPPRLRSARPPPRARAKWETLAAAAVPFPCPRVPILRVGVLADATRPLDRVRERACSVDLGDFIRDFILGWP